MIRSSDKRSPEYGYSNTTSGALRLLTKTDQEGGDAAAHLVISLIPSEPDTYIALLEGVTAIYHRSIVSALNGLLSQFYTANPSYFTFPDPSGTRNREGNIRQHEFKPRFKMQGHISDKLVQDIENGSIGDIELRNNHVNSTVGNDPFITSKSFRLTLSVGPNIPKQGVLNRIVTAVRTKHRTYDTAKIHFKDQTGHAKSVEIDVATGAVEQAYVQARRVAPIFPPLRMTTDSIVDRIAQPMRDILIDYR